MYGICSHISKYQIRHIPCDTISHSNLLRKPFLHIIHLITYREDVYDTKQLIEPRTPLVKECSLG